MSDLNILYNSVIKNLEQYGQMQLLNFYNDLRDNEKESLLSQIDSIDFNLLALNNVDMTTETQDKYEPIKPLEIDEINKDKGELEKIGTEAIQKNKVGVVLLAGGQGSRLGINKPKGMLNIGVSKPLYLFEILISNTLSVVKATNTWIPFFIMTNRDTYEEIILFFKDNNYFGYDKEYLFFFCQDMAPSLDFNGKIMLEDKCRVSFSPNGNGGWFSSLVKAGLLDTIKDFGIEWLNVFSVDNALQRIADPCFIGATIKSGCNCGTKVVRKASPDENVGVPCFNNGKPSIVDYFELPDSMKLLKSEKGELILNFGVTLNYLFKVEKLEQMFNKKMPIHIVKKKIPYIDNNGVYITPEVPNGYKFEVLITDMIYSMKSLLPYEVERQKEFAPIKNMTGTDSLESARRMLKVNNVIL